MEQAVLSSTEEKMKKTLESAKHELSTIRSGRASSALLDKITVEAYGTEMPLKQVAGISTPEGRLIVITAFDKSVVQNIEKAIMKSDLGLTPNTEGTTIRLPIPPLTEERRRDLVKVIKKKIEDAKVIIRNIRRDANEELKSLLKNQKSSEDSIRRSQEHVQKITDRISKELDDICVLKEKEIMEV